ncbi:MAG: hypothetical protein IPM66_12850 [Acidobacteriota bacterium]|nr:MAG: hypothetical protein IPM66_12850 [Acidobacteriota bacterium]
MKYMLMLLMILVLVPARTQHKQDVSDDERITIGDLKRKLDRKEEVIIIDARAGSSWIGSSVRIKGSIHITTDQLDAGIDKLPKNKEIVIYCT